MLCGPVSSVGATCDIEALHVLEMHMELVCGQGGLRLGRVLCSLQEKIPKIPNVINNEVGRRPDLDF